MQTKSMQFILSVSFTIAAVIIIMGISFVLVRQYQSSAREQSANNNVSVLNQMNLNLNNYLHNMMNISDTVYYSIIKNTDFGKDSLAEVNEDMRLLYDSQESSVVSIVVFDNAGDVIAGQPYSKLKLSANPKEEEWFLKSKEQIENVHFSTPQVENLFNSSDNVYHWVVSLSRAVELTVNGKTKQGVLLVNMNFTGIEQICKNVDLGEKGYTYIIDNNGEIVYHPRQQLIYNGIISEDSKRHAAYADGVHVDNFEGEKRQITVKTVGYTGWKIIGVLPVAELENAYTRNTNLLWIVVIGGIILLLIVNIVVSSRVTKPIKKLEQSVIELESNALEAEVSISGSYEVRHLGKTLKSLVINTKKLMKGIVKEQESKRKSEIDALQSQINPHFLYNTLDSVVWMIENEKYEGAITMITALAKLFRISLSKGKHIISIENEIQHVENYLIIQKVRYKNKFEYKINVEDKLLQCGTIKLIIQPFAENAIYHGLEFMDGEGMLSISVFSEDDDHLSIEISDNGPGMMPEMLEDINKGNIRSSRKKGSGIGINNVRERINLYFGEIYGVNVESEPDEGTIVKIKIPKLSLAQMERKEKDEE